MNCHKSEKTRLTSAEPTERIGFGLGSFVRILSFVGSEATTRGVVVEAVTAQKLKEGFIVNQTRRARPNIIQALASMPKDAALRRRIGGCGGGGLSDVLNPHTSLGALVESTNDAAETVLTRVLDPQPLLQVPRNPIRADLRRQRRHRHRERTPMQITMRRTSNHDEEITKLRLTTNDKPRKSEARKAEGVARRATQPAPREGPKSKQLLLLLVFLKLWAFVSTCLFFTPLTRSFESGGFVTLLVGDPRRE